MNRSLDNLLDDELTELATEATSSLLDWFAVHENDIALGFKDYGRLKSAYQWFVGELPKPNEVH
jgi:hypothetical protein